MEFGIHQQQSTRSVIKQPESRNLILALTTCSGFLILLILILKNTETISNNVTLPSSNSLTTTFTSAKAPDTKEKIFFTLKRQGYDPLDYFNKISSSEMNYEFLESYDGVVEPSAPMVLHVYANQKSTTTSDVYHFKICSSESDASSHSCQKGIYNITSGDSSSVKFSCTPHESTYTIDLYESSTSSDSVASGTAVCVYVRRELRALSATDLEIFISTAHVLWELTDEEGRARYGSNYHSSSFLLQFHQVTALCLPSSVIHALHTYVIILAV